LLTIYIVQFSDVASLLRTYQLWMDDLYPRAKFTDAMAIIEKLGHTKNMQRLRSEWINENRQAALMENDSDPEHLSATAHPGTGEKPHNGEAEESNASQHAGHGEHTERNTDDTEPAEQQGSGSPARAPDMDELDQLLAGEAETDVQLRETRRNSSTSVAGLNATTTMSGALAVETFDDDEDAMRDLGFW
jgi:replication fork protection complex subunit Csm3/Swi3